MKEKRKEIFLARLHDGKLEIKCMFLDLDEPKFNIYPR